MPTLDAYVRVSRVGGREGEAYHSPAVQEAEVRRWGQFNGVEIGRIEIDQDVSGSVAVAERKLERLLVRVEQGVSNGIICYRLDRFGRDATETALAYRRIKLAGGRLVAVADGFDSDSAGSRMMINFLSAQAEDYLDRVKQNWQAVTVRAVDRGVHVASRAPLGYLRKDRAAPEFDSRGRLIKDGRLVLDPATHEYVKKAYEMRAAGDSHGKIVKYLSESLGRNVAKSAVTALLQNRVYLGEARGPGGIANADAHEPIVDKDLYDRVQAKRGTYEPRDGSLTKHALLSALITCAACGHKLSIVGTTVKGKRVPAYSCRGHFASGDCESPASALVSLVDDYVVSLIDLEDERIAELFHGAERRLAEAKAAVAKAEADLDSFLDPEVTAGLDRERLARGIETRRQAVANAKRMLYDLDDVGLPDDLPALNSAMGDIIEAATGTRPADALLQGRGDDSARDRLRLRRVIGEVTLAKADPKRRRWQPIGERVSVRWVGESSEAA